MDPNASPQPPSAPEQPSRSRSRFRLVVTRGLVLVAIFALLTYIAGASRTLWDEWSVLQGDLARTRSTVAIGYSGITPHFSYAQSPSNWFHDEGSQTLLWGGWKDGVGHTWFRVAQGDINRARISPPIGRDVLRAIDHPLVESGGGTIWDRIPDEAFVAGHDIEGVETAYPLLLLDKVAVVNDVIADRPLLVTYNTLLPHEKRITIYEPTVAGQRVTMGLAGYFLDQSPLLYDRGTESLWVGDGESLMAVAGRYKGTRLPRIGHPEPVSWSRWRGLHPKGRLIIGADRSRASPTL